jgi:hypothetical protein
MKKITLLVSLLCVNFLCYAGEKLPQTSRILSFVNTSTETLAYIGVTETNLENIFLVSPKVVLPGKTVTVTIASNNYNIPDLSGNLQFQDNAGKRYSLHVSDPRQMHFGQRTFATGTQSALLTQADPSVLELANSTITNKKTPLTHDVIM